MQNPKDACEAGSSHGKGWNTLTSLNTHNNNFLFKKPSLLAMFQSGLQQILNYYEPTLVSFDMSQAITILTALWQIFKHLQKLVPPLPAPKTNSGAWKEQRQKYSLLIKKLNLKSCTVKSNGIKGERKAGMVLCQPIGCTVVHATAQG